jgi:hypothetical protein
MIDLGIVKPGATIYIPFGSYDGGTGATSAASAFVVGDIKIYKDGDATQRASTSGFTATASFDTTTGINLVGINLADNTTANFYEAGSDYFVVVGPITIDAQTVELPLAHFTIGYPGAILNTTIATLASQTSFTLEDASLLADVYTGCTILVHQLDSAVDLAIGLISAYTVTTKTVTLAADPGGHTMAAGDNVSIFMPNDIWRWRGTDVATPTTAGVPEVDVTFVSGTAQTAGDIPALVTTVDTVVDGIQTDLDNGTDGLGALKTLIDALNDVSLASITTEISDALRTDTLTATPQGAPPTTPTIMEALMTLYDALVHKIDIDSGFKEFYNNGGTVIWKKALSDDASNYVEAESETGP